MNRISLLVLLALTGLCLEAQTSSTITISTVPGGARFIVDGQLYIQATTLVWPAGSKHILVFPTDQPLPNQPASTTIQTSDDATVQYAFGGWVDNAGLLIPSTDPVQTITADPRITSLQAKLTASFRVMLNFFTSNNASDPLSPPTCGSPGTNPGQVRPGVVFLGSTCYWSTVNVFIPANSLVNLNAIPYPGFVFIGWVLNSGSVNPYLTSLKVTSPMTIGPMFSPGKRVSFLTNPVGLKVLVDHTPVPTRTSNDTVSPCPFNETQQVPPQSTVLPLCLGDFDFAGGSQHTVGAPSPQLDNVGKWWVFNSFSNGLGPNAVYKTDFNLSSPDTLTANFDPGATVSLVTNPTGLKLTVDGRQNWPSYNFIWALGTSHQVSAPASQLDSKGRQYTFQSWSNGGGTAQTVNVDQPAVNNGYRIIASYSVLNRVVVQSVPMGLAVQVDGTSCQTPCTLDRQSGAQLHVTAPTQIPMGAGARLDFASWSDGGTSDHTFAVNQDYTTITANYTNSYQLSVAATPASGISFQLSPSSSDMFFAENSQVTVTANPNPGFKFLRWGGDLSGTYPSGVVTMSVPRNVTAQANAVPYIPPAGVRNAAGATPASSVAPGSIISIYGQGLAPDLEIGRVNPLAQSISGVTVTVNDRILGLLFVSPQQINAQVPSDLPNGDYTLQVHSSGQPDVSTSFTVSRDAPGLFFQSVNSQQYAVALHDDGSMVTSDNPAKAGETISLLGTGFGPYNGLVVDGFFPPEPPPALADTINILAADQSPAPVWSGAAAGYTGVVVTSFQVPAGMASGANVSLKVNVNGVDSNTVMLPIQ
jgi:uncharacterized protein (TIGR03437 family)